MKFSLHGSKIDESFFFNHFDVHTYFYRCWFKIIDMKLGFDSFEVESNFQHEDNLHVEYV